MEEARALPLCATKLFFGIRLNRLERKPGTERIRAPTNLAHYCKNSLAAEDARANILSDKGRPNTKGKKSHSLWIMNVAEFILSHIFNECSPSELSAFMLVKLHGTFPI
jgi:hypothetical protein